MSLFQIDAFPEWRDAERQVIALGRELREKGRAFHIVVEPESPLHKRASEEGMSVIPLRMRGGWTPAAVWRLSRAMSRERCVVAHFHDPFGARVGAAAAAKAAVPVRVLSQPADSAPPPVQLFKDIDAVIAATETAKGVLVRGGVPEGLVEVVPPGTDFSPFTGVEPRDLLRREFGFGPDDFLAGTLAHLADERGHWTILEAARILWDHAPKVKIVVFGEGSLRLEIDEPGSGFGADNVFYYLGRHGIRPQILASLDAFVASSHLEGLGVSLLEAMASRVPVVATDTGAVPEVIVRRETGLLVPPRNSKALAEAILKIYLDKILANRLAQHGFEAVHEKHSAEAMARRIIAVYERLARRKGTKVG